MDVFSETMRYLGWGRQKTDADTEIKVRECIDIIKNASSPKNVFLIEVGGKENTKEEVENTLNVLINSVEEYIRGILWLVIRGFFTFLYGSCLFLF